MVFQINMQHPGIPFLFEIILETNWPFKQLDIKWEEMLMRHEPSINFLHAS